ncbi:LAMI_0A05798g1_1 [Lachancea mirantina]|uniref:LAMI_0A05798g1_1 n=1 Tax=Lachancea mirantina TaxID=1230905 RepID=A0A1G4IQI4_9SACH|nr:LAMI_0A05798g1_1 [Lachancea mirantina]
MDGQWDIVITSLKELYSAQDATSFDDSVNEKRANFQNMTLEQLEPQLQNFERHAGVLDTARKLIESIKVNLEVVIEHVKRQEDEVAAELAKTNPTGDSIGRCFWSSPFNPSEPVLVGSEVAFKPKRGGEGEWFECQVTKISDDGTRYEIRDPEPDEYGNPGQIYKCSWKDIILIPPASLSKSQLPNYPPGTKALARYPETTTFYPAVVTSTKRDGTCRLRFEGEEEVDKETEVIRRFVLPYPTRR